MAILSLWSKQAIIAPNNLIDSQHYKRHKKIRMTKFHSPSLSILILIITQSKVSFFNNFKLLQNDPETGRIFSQPPLKGDKNVGNFLVRSTLKTNEQPGTFKCVWSGCKTFHCLFIVNTSKILGPKGSVKITDRFTCTSANAIY